MLPDRRLFAGRDVAVLGTAPGATLPLVYDEVLCANSAPRSAVDAGAKLSRQIVTGYMTSLDYRSSDHVDLITGLHIPQVWALETFQGTASVVKEYASRGITYEELNTIHQAEWAEIAQEVCGQPLGRHVVDGSDCEWSVSTGMFCACFALYTGAKKVILCGISMDIRGFFVPELSRPHQTGDARALRALFVRFPGQISTTSSQMSALLQLFNKGELLWA